MMVMGDGQQQLLAIKLKEKHLSIIVFSLFSAWMLAFLFEGPILLSLLESYGIMADGLIYCGIAGVLAGLLICGALIKTKNMARRLFLYSFPVFFLSSILFFFPPSPLWMLAVVFDAVLAGMCVAAWGFFLGSSVPAGERIMAVADMLILSNLLMVLLGAATVHLGPRTSLTVAMALLLPAWLLARQWSVDEAMDFLGGDDHDDHVIASPLLWLCLFVGLITINSGIMYEVINPAFAHLDQVAGWYFAVPYIAAVAVIRDLPSRVDRSHTLYVAIAMMGLSFIAFVTIGRSLGAYLVINTLMLGACGVYDLFWWSMLGEMLNLHHNPARILGCGLAANVLGILIGAVLGNAVVSASGAAGTVCVFLPLIVIFVTLALLPFVQKRLSTVVKDHTYLTMFAEIAQQQVGEPFYSFDKLEVLSERENEVTALLLQGKTYKRIADDLCISENTVKYYVKNIYSKLQIKSRSELIDLVIVE